VGSKRKSDSQAGDDRRKSARGGKPIRLADLIPSRDVKGGASTIFGASKVPGANKPDEPPNS
jgi:hypothetical protein